jgi:hypothetical protein
MGVRELDADLAIRWWLEDDSEPFHTGAGARTTWGRAAA